MIVEFPAQVSSFFFFELVGCKWLKLGGGDNRGHFSNSFIPQNMLPKKSCLGCN